MTASAGAIRQPRPVQSGAPDADSKDQGARAAADVAVARNSLVIDVCGKKLELPPPDHLAFLAGLGVLTALEIMEWPVAVAIAVGHKLAHSHHGRALREFGDALEEA
ncbi:hypothetical protein ABZ027_10040 [Streptomyces sp. NPDC006332]|uniref:hypothetical protein n=1 Tax=Streptomyces sp. NPDC006332 TaxID=3155456 RepID=UPI00339E27C4